MQRRQQRPTAGFQRPRGGISMGPLKPNPPVSPEGVKKSIRFLFTSFRRKPESSAFRALRTDWTPVFTGVTAEIQFFQTFPFPKGDLNATTCLRRTSGKKKPRLKGPGFFDLDSDWRNFSSINGGSCKTPESKRKGSFRAGKPRTAWCSGRIGLPSS
jgi:hypothetical protein